MCFYLPVSAANVQGWCRNILTAARVLPCERVRVLVDDPLQAAGEDMVAAVRTVAGADGRLVLFPLERPLLEPTVDMLESSDWAELSIGLLSVTYAEELTARRLMLDRLLRHGGRAISADGIDHATLLGELSVPMPDLGATTRRLLDAVHDAREIRVRGSAGTDLTLRVEGRRWLNDALPLEPGVSANFPGGEICIAPLSDGAHGELVADLTIPWGPEETLLPEAVRIASRGAGHARSKGA